MFASLTMLDRFAARETLRSRFARHLRGDPRRPAGSVPPVEARGLVKRYGEREALRGVDFAAEPGELVAVIGPNGAGKTTLLSILAGTLKPTRERCTRPMGTSAGCRSRRRSTGG